jgi:hypothetical protein
MRLSRHLLYSAGVITAWATLALSIAPALAASADFAKERPSAAARQVADGVLASNDHRGRPFLIVDKPQARLFVFDAKGVLRSASPVLLGAARGDHSVPGIGDRKIADIRPEERTTPAGRFAAEPGHNAQGDDIVWIDYDAAISMHRVRATKAEERRLERLASPTVEDNRISYGCVNVPAAFFDQYVKPSFGDGNGRAMVYVLPDQEPLRSVFRFNATERTASTSAKVSRKP